MCVPANLFKKSIIDIVVPPIFAALVVATLALFVQRLGYLLGMGDALL
jgi:hypothetical protein